MGRLWSLLFLSGMITSLSAQVEYNQWSAPSATSASGTIGATSVTATTSATAPFTLGDESHLSGSDWNTPSKLPTGIRPLAALNVNSGDFQQFQFSSPISHGLLYVENFDQNSLASFAFDGATAISLMEKTSSISYAPLSASSASLSTSNATSNGEGDFIIDFQGNVSSIRVDYTGGDGSNGVFYSVVQFVPEPSSLLMLGSLLFGLSGLRRRRS